MGMMRLNLKNKKSNFFITMILLWFTFTKQNTMKRMALKKLSIQSTNNKQMQQENTKIKFSPFITLEINSSDFSFLSLYCLLLLNWKKSILNAVNLMILHHRPTLVLLLFFSTLYILVQQSFENFIFIFIFVTSGKNVWMKKMNDFEIKHVCVLVTKKLVIFDNHWC